MRDEAEERRVALGNRPLNPGIFNDKPVDPIRTISSETEMQRYYKKRKKMAAVVPFGNRAQKPTKLDRVLAERGLI